MSVTTLLPNSGLISKGEAKYLGNDGTIFTSAPTTGLHSPANYVQNGITSPDDSTYWTTQGFGPGAAPTPHFYIGTDKMIFSPSGLTLKVRANGGGFGITLDKIEVWLRKEHNPSLVADIQVASGVSSVAIAGGSTANYSKTLNIIEANRTAFESGLPTNYMCVSGLFNLTTNTVASGTIKIFEMELELSGEYPSVFNTANLFMFSSDTSSGNCDLYTFNSVISSGSCDLYTLSISSQSGSPNLYICGPNLGSGSFDLYLSGYTTSSGSFDLYTMSAPSGSNACSLYINGPTLSSGSFDLYTLSIATGSGSMNLVTKGPIGIPFSGHYVPLSIWSTTNSGVFKQVPLVAYNASTFSPQNAMNLTLGAITFQTQTGSMNLSLGSDPSVNNQFNLYLCNSYTLSSGWTSLYITTPSGTEGSVPVSGSMNLIMWRDANSIAAWVPLVLSNGGSGVDNVPLYIFGNTAGASSVPLYMFGIGAINNSPELYTHGF